LSVVAPQHTNGTVAGRVRSTPLRVKLLASVLALVFAALTLISVSSTFALRRYLLDRMDTELRAFAADVAEAIEEPPTASPPLGTPPSEYMVAVASASGVGTTIWKDNDLTDDDLPPFLTSAEAIEERVNDQPYTAVSINKRVHWRMMIVVTGEGDIFYIGRNMSEIEYAVGQLIWIDALVGLGVLIALAAVGAAIVRSNLRPLVEIEQTAGAIAAGDLTRRVPDPEPDAGEPRTELGRLSRALNAMLAQIEAAFTARAQSETAARAAESAARDAAEAAQFSEARAVRSEEKMRQFVADASHELRTPLTTIRGFAELYRQGAVTDPADQPGHVVRVGDRALAVQLGEPADGGQRRPQLV